MTGSSSPPITNITSATGMVIDPTNHYLYVVDDTCHFYTVPLDPATGLFAATSASSSLIDGGGCTAAGIAVDPNGKFVYVGLSNHDIIYVLASSAPGTVSMTPRQRFNLVGQDVHGMAVSGSYLFWSDGGGINLDAATITGGVLSNARNVIALPYSGASPQGIAIDDNCGMLYVTEPAASTNAVYVYDLNLLKSNYEAGASGSTPSGVLATLTFTASGPTSVAWRPKTNQIYVASAAHSFSTNTKNELWAIDSQFYSQCGSTTTSGSSKPSGGSIAGIVIGTIAGVLCIVYLLLFLYRRRKKEKETSNQVQPCQPAVVRVASLKYETDAAANA
jgi:DNA-binding beta-propeller fold protein YncE